MVSELLEMLDSARDQIGIVDWGIKMTTLEDGRNIIPLLHLIVILMLSFSLSPPW